ncbi:MAG: hypothetical protein E5X26_01145 [Mesorhizobium sp.]|nr:MAG: hypothetical protein E5X26_01145 [Mesorhizobium sp.]TIR62652.1 MAG: hypothetical protein E5X28_03525 [Mesorhizobium sp.]TIR71241.1 MAG: hypothetical protein E5X24_06125 [Mesorhizobium sp.]TIR75703.1 MAG: hypothetical protein E5X18_07190 [Mesorhizobium sp.]
MQPRGAIAPGQEPVSGDAGLAAQVDKNHVMQSDGRKHIQPILGCFSASALQQYGPESLQQPLIHYDY